MKFKFRAISLLVLIAILSLSLSSCLFLDAISSTSETDKTSTNTTINIGDIKNYDVDINTQTDGLVQATSKALMSSVSIFTDSSSGSGVIFKMNADKSEAYVLTNYHVVYNNKTSSVSNEIMLCLYGMEMRDYVIYAEYLGGTVAYDLAVLKVTNSPVLMASNAAACTFADSNKIAVLETAIAVGNANAEGISATLGRINVDSEEIELLAADEKTELSLRVLRTDAAVNSGNSGGGLFNSKGELIGIVNAKSMDSRVDNIGYAIPSNVAKYIAENIIHYCDGKVGVHSAYKCLLGIGIQASELYTEYDTETGILLKKEKVKVVEVSEKGAAEKYLSVGDLITSITIDGQSYEVSRTFHVVDVMLNARITSKVVITVIRDDKTLNVEIPLTSTVNADKELFEKSN